MKKVLPYFLYSIVALAIILRLAIFLQSRDLFLDEVNVARNLYEKGFIALLGPLDYEQFAPPLFLWISKLNSVVFGFSEMSLRLFPFISSVVSVMLLVYLIQLLIGKKYALYPLALFAGGYLFIHYGTELKQYSSDFMMTTILLIAALKSSQNFTSPKFVITWILLGSIALWLSMPAVFVLFAIGVYWLSIILTQKQYTKLLGLMLVGGFWLAQFALYFFLLLKDQISSDYLQTFHVNSFLYFPWKLSSLIHDLRVLSGMISQNGGFTTLALISNSVLLIIGSVGLFKKERWRSLLFFVPIVSLLFAALLHKYALVDRLVLFIHPILFVILAYGVKELFRIKAKIVRVILVVILSLNFINHQNFKYLFEKLEIQEIHYALDEIDSKQPLKQYDPIWVHNGAVPAFIFYTEMSPKKAKYDVLAAQGQLLSWDSNYENLYQELKTGDRVWILLSNYFPEEKENVLRAMQNATLLSTIDKPGCLLFQYEKK